MKIVEQEIIFDEEIDGEAILWRIERSARCCYKSEGKNSERDIAKRDALIRAAVRRGHTSVLEHGSVTFRVVTNRGVSHEWVRHRVGWSYSQESTRYCNYGHEEGITVILPWYVDSEDYGKLGNYVLWHAAMTACEKVYLQLLTNGCKPEEARGVLPNDLKTEIVCTANIVALRHFFELRCTKMAHPQIRDLARKLLSILHEKIPVVFDDLALKFFQEKEA